MLHDLLTTKVHLPIVFLLRGGAASSDSGEIATPAMQALNIERLVVFMCLTNFV